MWLVSRSNWPSTGLVVRVSECCYMSVCEDDSDSDASEDSASDNVSPVDRSAIAFTVFSRFISLRLSTS